MKKEKLIQDRGSALITVIIAMFFIGVIASIVLSLSMKNLDVIRTGEKSSDNFYTAETVVDELKTKIKEKADDAIAEAYKEWLQQYSLLTEAERDAKFKEMFGKKLIEYLGDYFVQASDSSKPTKDYAELLYTYGSGSGVTTNWYAGYDDDNHTEDKTDKVTIEYDPVEGNVRIKNISINYTGIDDDGKSYSSTITTDLVLNVEKPSIAISTATGVNSDVAEYALISDRTIANCPVDEGDTIAVGRPTVIGNIYAGGKSKTGTPDGYGLLFGGNEAIKLYSDVIVTRTNIATKGVSDLTIKGRDGIYEGTGYGSGLSYSKNIWTGNIDVLGDNDKVSIQGSCYVADDLSIDGKGASVSFTGNGSEFYGYNTNSKVTSAESSSSIVVNGEYSGFYGSALKMLWLAGKSYISVPKLWGASSATDDKQQEGESITYKALQAAYLLPGECIPTVGHNPMSAAEYNSKIRNKDEEGNPVIDTTNQDLFDKLDLSLSRSSIGSDLSKFLDVAEPVKPSRVQFIEGGEELVYIYLNFRTPDKAADYFQNYFSNNDVLVSSKMGSFNNPARNKFGAIEVPDRSRIISTGNIVAYSYTGGVDFIKANRAYTDTLIKNKQSEYSMKYRCYRTSLNNNVIGPDSDISSYIANMDEVVTTEGNMITDTSGNVIQFYIDQDLTRRNAYMLTSVGDYHIVPGGVNAGILICKGNVYIDNADFWGTIIATGNIYLSGTNARVVAVPNITKTLIQNNALVNKYFTKESGSEGAGGNVDTSKMVNITYDNWKKD